MRPPGASYRPRLRRQLFALSHIAEQMFSIHLPATYGFGLNRILERLKDTYFLAVPRVWEKFIAALDSKLSELTGFKRSLVKWAMDVGRQSGHCAFSGQKQAVPSTEALAGWYVFSSRCSNSSASTDCAWLCPEQRPFRGG